jgi:hypothetical protein
MLVSVSFKTNRNAYSHIVAAKQDPCRQAVKQLCGLTVDTHDPLFNLDQPGKGRIQLFEAGIIKLYRHGISV